MPADQPNRRIKLLSYNIQAGIETNRYKDYVTKSWQHLLPHSDHFDNLDRIAQLASLFDIVALQEVDGGSFRTGYVNQVEYLAQQGQFDFWHQQRNRNFGKMAQHSNGLLSRFEPISLEDHKLPGRIPGRGAIVARINIHGHTLVIISVHLSLGGKSQQQQLEYIRNLIQHNEHVVIMGDMNSDIDQVLMASPLSELQLQAPSDGHHTFPSWNPIRGIDHILVSKHIRIHDVGVIDSSVSDHLPIAIDLELTHDQSSQPDP